MNIGIVIDGVLTNLEAFQFDYGSKFYFDKEMDLKNPRAYKVEDMFHKHGNFLKKPGREITFWDTYYEYYLQKEKPRPFASEVIKKMHQQGFKIILFCTRYFFTSSLESEKIKHLTKVWLIENNIYFDLLIFSDIINEKLLKKYEVELFLDHNPLSMEYIATSVPIACFHAKYNETCKGDNIYRVYSWYDFYKKLDDVLQNEYMLEHVI